MAWIGGCIQFPDHLKYLIEHKVSKLNKYSKKEEWLECYAALRKFKHYIYNANIVEEKVLLFPSPLWTFVHHVAYHSAPKEIIQMISIDKYPLSLPDGEGKLAVDHIDWEKPESYRELFQPMYKIEFLPLEMKLIQANFHAVIFECVDSSLIEECNIILPILTVLLEDVCKADEFSLCVPNAGNFTYRLIYNETKSAVKTLLCKFMPSLKGGIEAKYKCNVDGWIEIDHVTFNS